MPRLLEEVYRLQQQLDGLEERERLLLKMFANLLEGHYEVKQPQNELTFEEFEQMPGRWEMLEGMLVG